MRKFFKDYTIGKVNNIKCNVTLLAENDVEEFNPIEYNNIGGNCLAVALCDIYNYRYGSNVFIPKARKKSNNRLYVDICNACWDKWYSKSIIYMKNLNELVEDKFTGVVSICCRGGYHAIVLINGMILNNWRNRDLQTLESFKKEMKYQKNPKVVKYLSISDVLESKNIFEKFSSYLINSK